MSPTLGAITTSVLLLILAALCCLIEVPQLERRLEQAAFDAAAEMGIPAEAVTAAAVGPNLEVRLEGATQTQAVELRDVLRRRQPLADLIDIEPTGEAAAALDPVDAGAGGPTAARLEADVNALVRERRIEFEPGTAALTDQGRETLDQIADLLRIRGLTLQVEGHTDSTGNPAANLELSRLRAESVVTYLSSVGLEHNRMTPVGYGDARPIADNATAEGQRQNRRVEFRIDREERP